MSVTHFFNKDVKFKELQNLDVGLIDNRQRAQDFGEFPFIIQTRDSWVGIDRYQPTEDGNIDEYVFDRVYGTCGGNVGKVLEELASKLSIEMVED